MNILLLMSGSIACAKTTGLISLWSKKGHTVKVVCTTSVFQFIGKATIEGLSGNAVISSIFEEDNMMEHIHLSRWADKVILAPATANIINKIAAGIADDMVTTTWVAALSLNKPMYIAPAMNSMMWVYPATQESILKLQSWKVKILLPQAGELACGEVGTGRLMEINDIDKIFTLKINKKDKHILITAGGTREYVDGVRYIGNLSTGKTGAEVADYFSAIGYHVTWLGAINAVQPHLPCSKVFYETFKDLADTLKQQLQNNHFDTIIHAAAISDFSVCTIKINNQDIIACRKTKLPTSDSMELKLKRNPKLVSQLLQWSKNLHIKVVAFKLTNTDDSTKRQKAVYKLLRQDGIDFVAHNDLSDICKKNHPFTLYISESESIKCNNTQNLCKQIDLLQQDTILTKDKGVKLL
ncbi:MAG: bifunctional phosphopantothenoylcysteine decarboxylase/phosphopantothenate--cysteine ligase CoaBC [Alcanivoracaceae bacterium]|nr:bifunctional phosphopantothenoylcysteine decarboxylase/phosphopantothenate--cysteine ligase CoaBC [Alcanivoracaceae bacterium]